jgi:hypothetical protein
MPRTCRRQRRSRRSRRGERTFATLLLASDILDLFAVSSSTAVRADRTRVAVPHRVP